MNTSVHSSSSSESITVLIKRPLRLCVDLRDDKIAEFQAQLAHTDMVAEERQALIYQLILSVKAKVIEAVPNVTKTGIFKIFTVFNNLLNLKSQEANVEITADERAFIRNILTFKDPKAFEVIEQAHLEGEPAPLYGIFERHIHGKDVLVRYEEDIDLREERHIPKNQSIADFFAQEIQPNTPDAWVEVI